MEESAKSKLPKYKRSTILILLHSTPYAISPKSFLLRKVRISSIQCEGTQVHTFPFCETVNKKMNVACSLKANYNIVFILDLVAVK